MKPKLASQLEFGDRCWFEIGSGVTYIYFSHRPLKHVEKFGYFNFYEMKTDRLLSLYMNTANTVWILEDNEPTRTTT